MIQRTRSFLFLAYILIIIAYLYSIPQKKQVGKENKEKLEREHWLAPGPAPSLSASNSLLTPVLGGSFVEPSMSTTPREGYDFCGKVRKDCERILGGRRGNNDYSMHPTKCLLHVHNQRRPDRDRGVLFYP